MRRRITDEAAADVLDWVNVCRWVGVAVVGAVILTPFLWSLSTSLKVKDDILRMPPKLFPWPATLENYHGILTAGFPRYLLNSAIVAVCSCRGGGPGVDPRGVCGGPLRVPRQVRSCCFSS